MIGAARRAGQLRTGVVNTAALFFSRTSVAIATLVRENY
jgi:hypothetical protein